MSAPLAVAAQGGEGRWRWRIDPRSYDTTAVVRATGAAAIADLGVDNLQPPGPPRPGRWRVATDPATAPALG